MKIKKTDNWQYDFDKGWIIDEIKRMKSAITLLKKIGYYRINSIIFPDVPESRLINVSKDVHKNLARELEELASSFCGGLVDEVAWFEYVLKHAEPEELRRFCENKLTTEDFENIQGSARHR